MTASVEKFYLALDNISNDAEKYHDIIHGDTDTVVETDNGPVDSLAKTIAGINGEFHNHNADYSPIAHNHTGTYEPADAAIQTHLADADKHRQINDAGVATTDLWSANKISGELSGKAASAHNHDTTYSLLSHDHAAVYSPLGHDHNADYSPIAHDHTGTYEPADAAIQTHLADADKHRQINDAGVATTDLWSANKIINGVQQANLISANAGGTVDAITATFSPALPSLIDGILVIVRASGANTSTTPTFAPDGLTAQTIVKENNVALAAGDIAGADHELLLKYNSTLGKWLLLNPKSVAGTGGGVGIPDYLSGGYSLGVSDSFYTTNTGASGTTWTKYGESGLTMSRSGVVTLRVTVGSQAFRTGYGEVRVGGTLLGTSRSHYGAGTTSYYETVLVTAGDIFELWGKTNITYVTLNISFELYAGNVAEPAAYTAAADI